MRLDKYLKVSRIIKRRTVAKDACDGGRVLVNGKAAKAGIDIKEDDIIEIQYANKSLKYKVLAVAEHVRKEDASKMYEIVG
ncbi:RNA-binding S4 domain-containing protein [Clostridium oceanicum]|uniref:RQC P-site tRNA stabilizing factor n=1 Tax=Clostridium oceanicum TaxID=1543 RepID=A0ABP3V0E5_9CLOT